MPPDANLGDYVDVRLQTAAIEPLIERGCLQQSKDVSAIAIWTLARDGNLDMMKRVAALHRRYSRKKGASGRGTGNLLSTARLVVEISPC